MRGGASAFRGSWRSPESVDTGDNLRTLRYVACLTVDIPTPTPPMSERFARIGAFVGPVRCEQGCGTREEGT